MQSRTSSRVGLNSVTDNNTFNREASQIGLLFANIVYGKNGIPAEELTGIQNVPRLINATSKMYGRYMAHVMSQKFRRPFNASEPRPPPLQGIIYTAKPRLVQHIAPKIALQVLLGIMTLCGMLSWMLMPKVKFLPHDPCSIAGTAHLLAEDDFWSGKKRWDVDQMFQLETRNGRFGIYAVGAESRRLLD